MKGLPILLLTLAACSPGPSAAWLPWTPPTSTPDAGTPGAAAPLVVPISMDEGSAAALLPPQPQPEPAARPRRRMDLDQLDASLRRVMGGVGWTETRGGSELNLYTELAPTLGKPDYATLTQEDLEPGAIFQKFLGDAARAVCARRVELDRAAPAAERVLFATSGPEARYSRPADVPAIDRDLAGLLLHFHGRSVAPDAAALEPWRWLFRSAEHVSGSPLEAWRTVCIGLMTHPDFYTF